MMASMYSCDVSVLGFSKTVRNSPNSRQNSSRKWSRVLAGSVTCKRSDSAASESVTLDEFLATVRRFSITFLCLCVDGCLVV